jgi:hypothetical protein
VKGWLLPTPLFRRSRLRYPTIPLWLPHQICFLHTVSAAARLSVPPIYLLLLSSWVPPSVRRRSPLPDSDLAAESLCKRAEALPDVGMRQALQLSGWQQSALAASGNAGRPER